VRCQLLRVAQARPDAEDDLCTDKGGQGVLRSLAEVCVRPGGSRRLQGEACAERAQQGPVLLGVLYHLGPGRRFGAKALRHQPGAGGAGPRGQGPLPAAGGPVPGPYGGLGQGGGDSGYPFERSRGPGPVQGHKDQLQPHPGPAVITSHPGIVAPAAGIGQAPRLPDAAARRARAPVPRPGRIRASAPVAHLLEGHLLAGLRDPRHLLLPGADCRAAGPAGPVGSAADPAVPWLAAGQRADVVPAGPAGDDLAAAEADRPR
jgi:hypothetical protein